MEIENSKGWDCVLFIFTCVMPAYCRISVEVFLNKLIKLHKIETLSENLRCGRVHRDRRDVGKNIIPKCVTLNRFGVR